MEATASWDGPLAGLVAGRVPGCPGPPVPVLLATTIPGGGGTPSKKKDSTRYLVTSSQPVAKAKLNRTIAGTTQRRQ